MILLMNLRKTKITLGRQSLIRERVISAENGIGGVGKSRDVRNNQSHITDLLGSEGGLMRHLEMQSPEF